MGFYCHTGSGWWLTLEICTKSDETSSLECLPSPCRIAIKPFGGGEYCGGLFTGLEGFYPRWRRCKGRMPKSMDTLIASAMKVEWIFAYQGDGAKVIIPPQLRVAQATGQEAQSHGDGGGNDADGGHHDDHHLTAIQTIIVG